MIYKKGSQKDVNHITRLARQVLGQDLGSARVAEDIERYPNEVAVEKNQFIGFALSEKISQDILFVCSLAVQKERRCDKVGRCLLEMIESQAMEEGYHSIVAAGLVQRALLGCQSDEITFAGYKSIYDTGGDRLLVKCIN